MDWLKKHADTITILGMFAICFWNMNEKMNEGFRQVDQHFAQVEKDMAIMKTVLIMKNIIPCELAEKGD